MGKGRDKRKRKAKKKDNQTRSVARAIPEPSGDPPISGEPDAPVLTPLKPRPHLPPAQWLFLSPNQRASLRQLRPDHWQTGSSSKTGLLPHRPRSYRNSQDGTESELETCHRLFSSTQDHDQEDRADLSLQSLSVHGVSQRFVSN